MADYFAAARRAFQENLASLNPQSDPVTYNFYAGMVALASGLEAEINAMKDRLAQMETELERRQR